MFHQQKVLLEVVFEIESIAKKMKQNNLRAPLNYLSVLQNKYLMSVHNCGQSVCDDESTAVLTDTS